MKSIFLTTPGRCGTHFLKKIILKLFDVKLGIKNFNPNIETFKTFTEYVKKIEEIEYNDPGDHLYVGHLPLKEISKLSVNKIVLVRDPRDICVSAVYYWIMKGSLTQNKFDISLKNILKDAGPNPSFINSYLKDGDDIDHYLIKFEELINNTYEEMKKFLNYFEYDFDKIKLKKIIDKLTFKKLSEGREKGEEKSHHYRKGIIGDWKNYFSKEMNDFFCKEHKLLMKKWGYSE